MSRGSINQLTLKLARECLPLFQDARRITIVEDERDRPTDSTALAYMFDKIEEFEQDGGAILWDLLSALPPARFNIPETFDCDIRYSTTITGGTLLARLDDFCDAVSKLPAFINEQHRVYKNWGVRVVLRAGYALAHEREFRDVLMFAGLPSDPDMLETLYPNGTNLPDGLEIVQ